MLDESSLPVRLGYRARCSFGVSSRHGGPSSHDAIFRGRLSGPPYRPEAFGGSYGLSIRTVDQLECGNVGAFQPRLQRSPADFTGCVTGVRYQELGFSAFVLSTTIALDDCRHFRNMRLRRAGSSQMVRCKQK
jgi:hypothetical protein